MNATLTVDQSRFIRGGVGVVGGSFIARITNSLIVQPPGIAITLRSISSGIPSTPSIIAFNTIVGGVIDCSDPNTGGSPRFFNSNIMVDQTAALPKPSLCFYDYNEVMPPDFALGGVGNISMDPLFVNATSGDYHLQPTSPAINRADPTSTNDHDLDNAKRMQNGRSDIGAFERAQ